VIKRASDSENAQVKHLIAQIVGISLQTYLILAIQTRRLSHLSKSLSGSFH